MKYIPSHKLKSMLVALVAITSFGAVILLPVQTALAATGSLSISPSSSSLQNGQNVTMTININPGTAVNAVHIVVHYDTAKLSYSSMSYASSPFSFQPSAPSVSGGTVSFDQADLAGPVSTSSFVASLVFTSKVGTGSTSVTLADSNAANNSVATNPSTGSASLTFVTPTVPPTSTPTPTQPVPTPTSPSPTTPTNKSSGSSSSSSSTNSSSKAPSSSTSVPSTSGTSQPAEATVAQINTQVTAQHISFNTAELTIHTDMPAQVYIMFGTDKQLTSTTSTSSLGTDHTVGIDSSLLVPGTTYSYVVVTKSAQGIETRSAVQSFHTRGMSVRVLVLDKNKQPLRNQKVTLHSEPQTVTTDKEGYGKFSDVAPGNHEVIYAVGKKSFKRGVNVINNIATVNDQQTAPNQDFAVLMDYKSNSSLLPTIISLLCLAAVLASLLVLQRTGRLTQLLSRLGVYRHHAASAPMSNQADVSELIATSQSAAPIREEAFPKLAGPPEPGSLFKPEDDDNEHRS